MGPAHLKAAQRKSPKMEPVDFSIEISQLRGGWGVEIPQILSALCGYPGLGK